MVTKPIESLTTDDAETIREQLLIGNRNEANGFAGLDGDGVLIATFASRVGTDAEINAIVLASGEIAYTTDTLEVRVGDGVTAGGVFLYARSRSALGEISITSSTALSDISGLALSYKANSRYRVEFEIGATDVGAASNWIFNLKGSTNWQKGNSGSGNQNYVSNPLTWNAVYGTYPSFTYETGTYAVNNSSLAAIAFRAIVPVSVSKPSILLHGFADINTNTAGSFTLQAAQKTSSASALGVAGRMDVRRVA